jgi:hypothetical protein
MSKLIFKLKGDERKWDIILNEFMGEELAKECAVEIDATASNHSARVHILNFKKNQELINKLGKDESVLSAYLIDNKKITKRIR